MFRFICKLKIKTIALYLGVLTFLTCIVLFTIRKIKGDAETNAEIPIVFWWTDFMPERKRNCAGNLKCFFTANRTVAGRASAYLFYGSQINETDLPLPRTDVPWAIFHEESPKNLPFLNSELGQSFFNITSTFSRFSDLPLTLHYLKNIKLLTDKTFYIHIEEKNQLLDKLAPVLYLQSSCDTPSDRDKYVAELMQYVSVDSYGKCLNNKELPEVLKFNDSLEVYEANQLKFISQYKFIIAIENAICDDYITEKLWKALIVGAIPIYLGSPTVQDWLPNEKSALFIQQYDNIQQLAATIKALNNNNSLYNEYLQHKTHQKIGNLLLKNTLSLGNFGVTGCQEEFPIESFECLVCVAVYTNDNQFKKTSEYKNVYNCPEPPIGNSWRTHWTIGKCKAKALDYFINTLNVSKITPEQFQKEFITYFNKGLC